MALGQLLDELRGAARAEAGALVASSDPSDCQLVSDLLDALLACLRHSAANGGASASSDPSAGALQPARDARLSRAADLASQCLGELGAIDPWRRAQARADGADGTAGRSVGDASLGRAAHSSELYKGDISDTELCARLMEDYLVRALRDAAEGQVVQASAYALGVLLRRVCDCSAETPTRYQVRVRIPPPPPPPPRGGRAPPPPPPRAHGTCDPLPSPPSACPRLVAHALPPHA